MNTETNMPGGMNYANSSPIIQSGYRTREKLVFPVNTTSPYLNSL